MIYLDHAATTKPRPEVIRKMMDCLEQEYGNASANYQFASVPRRILQEARERIAASLSVQPEEIFFTSGGTESDNWAIRSAARERANRGRHIITSAIEHPAVLETMRELERNGYEITWILPDETGAIQASAVEAAVRRDTILISIMYANNETGRIQPIREIGDIARRHGVLFHTDAVQAYGQIPITASEDGFDLLSASGHKLYGPKGIGFLYIRSGTITTPLLTGGGQESGVRSGTENIPAIAGLSEAVALGMEDLAERAGAEWKKKERFAECVRSRCPYIVENGGIGERRDWLPGIWNFSLPGLSGEAMQVWLDMAGICVSTGSACASASRKPSHVLLAMGIDQAQADSSIRISIGRETTEEELQETAWRIQETAEKLYRLTGADRNSGNF